MKLTPEQIQTFDEQGYVFFPNCFSEDEVAVLRSEADSILRTDRREVCRAPHLPRIPIMKPSG